jgi:glycosyltransferase involved in cell wall biosynthesis
MELYMGRTACELARRGHAVLPVIHPQAHVLRAMLEGAGLTPRPWTPGLPELPLLGARRLARLLDEEGVEAVHAHYRRDLPLAALAKRGSRRRPRLAYTSQMKISHSKQDPYHNFIYGQLDALLTITAQLREQTRERLHPALRGRVRLLYYGTAPGRRLSEAERATLRAQHDLRAGVFTVGLFGQKFEGKGQLLLVQALARLRAEGGDCQALLVGSQDFPDFMERLRAEIAAHGLQDAVVLRDFVPEPQALMQLCDVTVLATYQETFGLVLIEAMSLGIPVIGSAAGGVPEIIDDGETGLLFETRNADSLYAALRRLHDDPPLRARLAAAGQRKAAARFSLARHYDELEAVLRGEWPPEAVAGNVTSGA